MSKARTSKTLESVTKIIEVNGTNLVQEEMRLGLADDEIAQLCMIDMEYKPDPDLVEDVNSILGLGVSLDPDSNLNPLTDDVEDLEYIAGMIIMDSDLGLSGTLGKTLTFEDKVNIGTNIGLTTMCQGAGRVKPEFIVTIWFLRKKASSIELAKILLKRR